MRLEYLLLMTLGLLALFFIKRHANKTIARQNEHIEELSKQIGQLSTTINALCASAVGVDKRVIKLERSGRDLVCRQESIEASHQSGKRPYGEAIQLAQKGAGVSRLSEELGLSEGEAELLVRLHGVKKAG